MIGIFCRAHHGTKRGLCTECDALWQYARERVDHCPFRAGKPTCLNCAVHCFKPAAREQIRRVMRYAGPRMTWRHPVLTLFHFIDGRRKATERQLTRHRL
ncbi:MAG: nitrous oxide-stimulated promoter family protein [Acidobacteriota bacterium]